MLPITLTLVAMLLLGSCDTFPADRAVGVSGEASAGNVLVHYVPCDAADITLSLTVYRVVGQVGADEDDVVLWSIARANEPQNMSGLIEYEVGVTPAGYVERVPLTEAIPVGPLIGVEIRTESVIPYIGFRMDELRPDSILNNDEYLSEREFAAQALETC